MAEKGRLTKPVRFALGCTGLFVFFVSMPFLYWMFLGPFVSYVRSLGWKETPCLILESGISMTGAGNSSGRRGQPTYRPQYAYSYEVDGTTYRSDRYWFFRLTFDSEERAKREAAQHPVGSRATCYVNPGDPADAVFSRELRAFQLIGLVFPLGVLGLAGVALAIAARPSAVKAALGDSPLPIERGGPLGPGAVVLRPMTTPFGNLVASVLGAIVWNGFLLLVVYFPSRDLWDTSPSFGAYLRSVAAALGRSPDTWMGVLCVSPFVFIGLFLIVSLPFSFLALFNPRPRLTLSSDTIPAGGSARLHWRLSDPAGRVRRLTMVLVRVSTKRTTTPERELPLVDLDRRADLQEGTVTVTLPDDAPASSMRGPDFVVWRIRVVGEIPLWPDVEAELPITVTRPT